MQQSVYNLCEHKVLFFLSAKCPVKDIVVLM